MPDLLRSVMDSRRLHSKQDGNKMETTLNETRVGFYIEKKKTVTMQTDATMMLCSWCLLSVHGRAQD